MVFLVDGSLPEWIRALATLGGTIVALVGVTIAAKGLTTWQRQQRGATRHGAAIEVLIAAFGLRQTLQTIRFSCVYGGPGAGSPREVVARAIEQFDEPAHAAMEAFDKAVGRAEAVFGADLLAQVKPIRDMIGKVRTAARNEIHSRGKDNVSGPRGWENFGWCNEDPALDKGTAELRAAFGPLEAWARPHIDVRP